MKKICFWALFLFSISCFSLDNKQVNQPNIGSVKINPIFLALGILDLHLGIKTSESTSVLLALDSHFFWPAFSVADSKELLGIGGGLGFRVSPFSEVHESGWFIESFLRAGYSGLIPGISHLFVIPSIESGYSWLFDNNLTVSTGLSINYIFAPNSGEKAWVPNFPIPMFNFMLGYVF